MFKKNVVDQTREVQQIDGGIGTGTGTGTRVVKSETRTVTRNGVTETTTTEVFEASNQTGSRATSQTVIKSTSTGDHHHLSANNDDYHGHKNIVIENKVDNKEKSKNKSKIGALLSKFGGRRSSSSSSSSSDSEEKSPPSFANECLKAHNEKRKIHGIKPLQLSDKLNKFAKKWADTLAKEDSFKHSDGDYGENIYMKWSSNPNHKINGADPVNSWYDEIKVHEFGKEVPNPNSGHFSQVIWKGSKELGVAHARSKTGKIIVVASYYPAGNMRGNYVENVPPPQRQK